MVVIGVDDTDSRTAGMCTTWIATEIVRRLPPASVERTLLVRLCPAIEHKTRGNGAVAIETTASTETAETVAAAVIEAWAAHDDPQTNPGLVVASDDAALTLDIREIAAEAVRAPVSRDAIDRVLGRTAFTSQAWGNGRGLIGATAAIGAVGARMASDVPFRDWTYEWLVYREPHRWGEERVVSLDGKSIDGSTRAVWDTVDPVTGELTCVPHSPCPVLFGIRGDDPHAVRAVGERIDGEPHARARLFETNQGTDAHLRHGRIGTLENGGCYRVRGTVIEDPTVRQGGHVTVVIATDDGRLPCLAFAPTGRFRRHVRSLISGDEILGCGEVADGSLKLEKFALVEPVLSERVTPTCPVCSRRMKSAGRGQGYRCRDCGTERASKVLAPLDRAVARGWYEVPPGARRHLAAPLVRCHHALPVHPGR